MTPQTCREKLYLIIPKSCDCSQSLVEKDERIKFVKTTPEAHIGNLNRVYTFDLYKFEFEGKVCFQNFVLILVLPYHILDEKAKITNRNQSRYPFKRPFKLRMITCTFIKNLCRVFIEKTCFVVFQIYLLTFY